jgi:hypothetical protein
MLAGTLTILKFFRDISEWHHADAGVVPQIRIRSMVSTSFQVHSNTQRTSDAM